MLHKPLGAMVAPARIVLAAFGTALPYAVAAMLFLGGVRSLMGCPSGYDGPYDLNDGGYVCLLPQASLNSYSAGSCGSGGTEDVYADGNSWGYFTYTSAGSANVDFQWASGASWTVDGINYSSTQGGGGGMISTQFSGTGSNSFSNESSSYDSFPPCPGVPYTAYTWSDLAPSPSPYDDSRTSGASGKT